ncbi:MAG: hypothetical protein IIC79_07285, partial [Chloroflexi bacterium]|nr:hypothetical protein [Chloroflexota bacterium]
MKRKIIRILYRSAYMLGVASLLVSLVLGAVPPAPAVAGHNEGHCGGDFKEDTGGTVETYTIN